MGARTLLRVATGALLLAALMPVAALADVTVEQSEAGWSVKADHEPLSKVLATLGKRAQIKVTGTEKLVTDPDISGSWQGDSDTILARILRGVDYAAETATDKHGKERIVRVVVLSGQAGKASTARTARQARKLPAPMSQEDRKKAQAEGKQVTQMLEARARIAAGQHSAPKGQVSTNPSSGSTSSGINRNADGTYDIDPATQARMAEATQQAQQNLQALVNSLRRAEQNQQGESQGNGD